MIYRNPNRFKEPDKLLCAAKLWNRGKDTKDISERIHQREWQVYSNMREIKRVSHAIDERRK